MSMLIASFPETEDICRKVAKSLGAKHTKIMTEDFPDSEFHLELKENPKNKTVVIISSMTKDPDEKLIETILAGGIAKDYGAKKVILVATYMPYMRQDKHFEKYDSFSSKHILELFRNFDKVIAIDPHLHRIKKMQQAYGKAESITTNWLVADYIKKRFGKEFSIVGPDAESTQWSSKVAGMLGSNVVILKKTRFSSRKIKQADIKGRLKENVIIIDDIISTGKTIIGAIKLARKHGAKRIIVIGIHGLLIGKSAEQIRKHAELITSNTIQNKYAKIDVSPAIVKALKRFK